jgi:hypothetical protein
MQNFAEVTMEGLAPMPLEQLSWGYLAQDGAANILLFAASRDRLTQDGLAPEESFFHVLPSFYAAAPADGAAAWVFIWDAGQLAAIHYEGATSVPTRVELEPVLEDTPAGAFAARDRLLKRLSPSARGEAAPAILARPDAARAARDRLQFFFASYASAEVEAEPVRVEGVPPSNPASLWTADLRDNVFRLSEQKRRHTLLLINRAMLGAGAAAGLLLATQLVWAGVTFWVNRTHATVVRQQPMVDQVVENQSLLQKIDLFSSHQLRPFEMLAAINDLRPPGILYKSAKTVTTNNTSQLIAQCIAPDASTMNQFTDALDKSQLMDVNPNMNSILGPRGVTFNLDVRFRQPLSPLPMPADKPPEPPPIAAAPLNLGRPNIGMGGQGPVEIQPAEAPPPGPDNNGQPPPGEPPPNNQPAVYINN